MMYSGKKNSFVSLVACVYFCTCGVCRSCTWSCGGLWPRFAHLSPCVPQSAVVIRPVHSALLFPRRASAGAVATKSANILNWPIFTHTNFQQLCNRETKVLRVGSAFACSSHWRPRVFSDWSCKFHSARLFAKVSNCSFSLFCH